MSEGLKIKWCDEEWVRLVHLSGEISGIKAFSPEEILPETEGMKAVVLNFAEVDYINSSGIALLIRLVRQARDKSLRVLVHGVSTHYQKIFEMVGLTNYLYLYPNEELALAAAGLVR